MITPYQLLQETGFSQYTAMCRFTYNRDNTSLGAEKLAEMVRAIPGSTRVSTVSLDKGKGIAIFNVKLISSKTPKEAFIAFKENALKKFRGMLLSVEVGAGTIEKKGDFIVQEGKEPRKQTHLGNYIGQLLEEGLLLEVSIEELRRQYVECDPPKLSAEIFEQIVQAAENKSNYATWLCKKVADGLVPAEDLGGWHDLFQFFDRYKQRFQTKDINQVKTAENIQDFKQQYEQAKEAVNAKKEGGKKEELEPCQIGTLKTSDGKTWKVYKTGKGQYDLERKIGSGAGWCTVSSQHMFNNYLDRYGGNYYIFVNTENPNREKYQAHLESNQFANIKNQTPELAQKFIIEFYEFLNKKEGKEIPERIKRAKEELKSTEDAWNEIKDSPSVVGNFGSQDLSDGGKLYRVSVHNSDNVRKNALLFRDLHVAKDEQNLVLAQKWNKGYNVPDAIYVLKLHDGTADLLRGNRNSYLASILVSDGDVTLPECTEDNVEEYKQAANLINTSIVRDVLIRTDKTLPSLETFKWREADTRTGYRFPAGSDVTKAVRQLDISSESTIRRLEGIVDIQEVLVCVDTEFRDPTVVTSDYSSVICRPADWNSSASNLDRMVKVVRFLGVDLNNPNLDTDLFKRLQQWVSAGRWQGILEALRNTVEVPGIDSNSITVADIQKIQPLTGNIGNPERLYAVYATGDISKVYVITPNHTYSWSPANDPLLLSSYPCMSQAAFREIRAIKPENFGLIFQHLGIAIPSILEKLLGRTKPGEHPNVLQFLRARRDQLQEKTINLHKYSRGYRAGTTYYITANGIYGTWEQIGPLIQQSSPDWYNRIVEHLANYQDHRIDAFIYYDRDNSRHTWSCIVRAINPETNQVDFYVRRYGDGMGVQWLVRTPQPEERANAGDQEANFVPLEPPRARAPRQRRAQEQPAAPAAPAPELAPEQQQQLEQYRQNIQAAQNVYRIPTNQADLIQALGFTNLANNIRNLQGTVIVYDAAEHRGNVTKVAVANVQNDHPAVVSLPGNQVFGTAQEMSIRWRTLTRILDNSVRTFQQCVDVCNQTHTPLPEGLQGWLLYRQAGQNPQQ